MKLLSWNIQWCRGVDGRVDPERIAREVRAMADADVICLQEVARGFDTLAGSQGEDQFTLLARPSPATPRSRASPSMCRVRAGVRRRGASSAIC